MTDEALERVLKASSEGFNAIREQLSSRDRDLAEIKSQITLIDQKLENSLSTLYSGAKGPITDRVLNLENQCERRERDIEAVSERVKAVEETYNKLLWWIIVTLLAAVGSLVKSFLFTKV
jgi:flagellar motility protein MotE (MotC chaperone)